MRLTLKLKVDQKRILTKIGLSIYFPEDGLDINAGKYCQLNGTEINKKNLKFRSTTRHYKITSQLTLKKKKNTANLKNNNPIVDSIFRVKEKKKH